MVWYGPTLETGWVQTAKKAKKSVINIHIYRAEEDNQ